MKLAILCGLSLTLNGCAALGPLAPGQTRTGESAGVRLTLETGVWSQAPQNLDEFVTPLRVTLTNNSEHPLRIRYSELVLRSGALDYEPLPPQKIVQENVEFRGHDPLLVPRFEHSGFRISRQLSAYYGSYSELPPWDYPWTPDSPLYERQYVKWTGSLPTVDMIETALPEGVLEPGGRLRGFLYFEKAVRRADEVAFEANLVDARTELWFGGIRIPF